MFAEMGEYEACGIFTKGHFILATITIVAIYIALKCSINKSKEVIHNIIKWLTIDILVMEILKIIYNIKHNSIYDVNTYVPLYYCSMLLYAGILSSFGKGVLKKIGDVSLASGAAIGGIVFIIYPSTSLPIYPAFHILSIHSFLFHGVMIYLGILVNKTKYVELKKEDIKYFTSLIGTMSVIALIVNKFFNGNLMFISNNFPNTPIEILYKITNGGILYSLIMIVVQMTIPFYISYYVVKKANYFKKDNIKEEVR